MNLGDLLGTAAARSPHQAAVVSGQETVSYQALEESTTRLACRLLEEGCLPGDRVAIHWCNSIEVVKLFFACFKAGLIAVPVNVRMKAPEVVYVLEHSKAVWCFSQPALAALAREASRAKAALRGVRTSIWDTDDQPAGRLPVVEADQPALILYTSGTTARPKGVTHTHRTLLATARLMADAAPGNLECVLVLTQMMHASGINCDLLPAILAGGTAVLVPEFDPAGVLDLIERHGCTYSLGLPALIQFLLEEQARRPRNVGSLKTMLAGGDSVPVSMQQRFQALFGIPLREGFGMTESLPSILNPGDAIRPGSLGKAAAGVEVRVIDLGGRDVAAGEIGELIVRSPANCVGYWEDQQASSEALRGGWLHTGDLGRRDADGYFWFEGRKKEIIVRGGSNISPQEVEEAVFSHPAVLEAAVIGMPDPTYGEKVVAFVALRPDCAATEQDLREHSRQRLADYKVPENVYFLDELPKGITGKLQRRMLKQMAN